MEDIGVTSTEGDNEKGGEITVHKCKHLEEKKDEREQQLLPGIADEVTVQLIAPKLPWTAFHILSSVSRRWQQAIQSRKVYDARVGSQSTQTLVALQHWNSDDSDNCDDIDSNFVLYSVDDGSCYHLPPVPTLKESIPEHCECVAFDGKLYVIGGRDDIYVLDLAAQRNWKRCANMIHPREEFGCGVIDGKIYVFGGRDRSNGQQVSGSEMYDPKIDEWFPATPIPSLGFNYEVITVGEELLVHTGWCYAFEIYLERLQNRRDDLDLPRDLDHQSDSLYQAEMYHPLRDEWKVVNNFTPDPIYTGIMLMVGGQVHHMTAFGTKVYDFDNYSWKTGQSYVLGESTFGPREPELAFEIEFMSAVVMDDVILAVADIWEDKLGHEDELPGQDEEHPHDIRLIISQKFCTMGTEIVWQDLKFPLSFSSYDWRSPNSDPFMCLIQL